MCTTCEDSSVNADAGVADDSPEQEDAITQDALSACEGITCNAPPDRLASTPLRFARTHRAGRALPASAPTLTQTRRAQPAARMARVLDACPWTTATIESRGAVGEYASLSLDHSGGVHISYYDETNGDLRYAYLASGGSWSTRLVDGAGNVGVSASIGVDAAGTAHVSYLDVTHLVFKYAVGSTSGAWLTSVIDSMMYSGDYSSLAVDSGGGVHVVYHGGNSTLKYGYLAPSATMWTKTTVDSTAGGTGRYTSLAVDSSGGTHVAYFQWPSAGSDGRSDTRFARRRKLDDNHTQFRKRLRHLDWRGRRRWRAPRL